MALVLSFGVGRLSLWSIVLSGLEVMNQERDLDQIVAQLAADEHRLERIAPSRAMAVQVPPLGKLLGILYLITAAQTVCQLLVYSPWLSLRYVWPSDTWLVPLCGESLVGLLAVVCAVGLFKQYSWVNKLAIATVFIRVILSGYETYVRGAFFLAWTTSLGAMTWATVFNKEIVRYCLALPFETVAPLVVLAVFVRMMPPAVKNDLCCLHCGYWLYGLDSDRCPECGEPFKPVSVR
jgi:hypothetical protein